MCTTAQVIWNKIPNWPNWNITVFEVTMDYHLIIEWVWFYKTYHGCAKDLVDKYWHKYCFKTDELYTVVKASTRKVGELVYSHWVLKGKEGRDKGWRFGGIIIEELSGRGWRVLRKRCNIDWSIIMQLQYIARSLQLKTFSLDLIKHQQTSVKPSQQLPIRQNS